MFAFIVRRLIYAIPLIILSTAITFLAVSLSGDPLDQLAQCTTCGEAARQEIIDRYNLDTPLPMRYLEWLGNAITGDFGESADRLAPVSEVVGGRFINTLYMAVPAFFLIAIVALALATISALKQYSVTDYTVTAISYFGLAMPTFFFGLLLQVFWGIWFPDWTGWKPFHTTGMLADEGFLKFLSSLVLPVVTLTLVLIAGESRFGRSAMLEIKNADYIRTARAKGVPEGRIFRKHILRNAMIPIVTVWALDAAAVIGGSVITESVFSWPGLGTLLVASIFGGDINVVMIVVVILSLLAVFFNLIADLAYGWLDPRIRHA